MGEILAGDSSLKRYPVEGEDSTELTTEDEKLTKELEEILNTCSKSEQEGPQQTDQEDSTITGEGTYCNTTKLKVYYTQDLPHILTEVATSSAPYTTDLEYLEDNFKLIETLVKATKTELSDEGWLIRGDQRKPEAVVRELKAKARSLKAKTEQRLEATRSQGGKWKSCT